MLTVDADATSAESALDAIADLPDNWNENGAPAINARLIDRARRVLALLPREPTVVPTARQSIWMEYHDAERGRLAFELFDDYSITQYQRNAAWETSRRAVEVEEMADSVRRFYE